MIAGLALSAASLAIVRSGSSLSVVLSSVGLFAAGISLTTASTKPLAAELSLYSGAEIGMLESIKDVGQALGPIMVGVLEVNHGFSAISAILTFSALASLCWWIRWRIIGCRAERQHDFRREF